MSTPIPNLHTEIKKILLKINFIKDQIHKRRNSGITNLKNRKILLERHESRKTQRNKTVHASPLSTKNLYNQLNVLKVEPRVGNY
mmetsp:Transcript_18790/g.16633  ORF Transcript_18790/g.16633 Transcript_18790/m.16633 type:complete len:85 (+) Transcript_18790:148-402(+)